MSSQESRRSWPRILVPQELYDLLYVMARREGIGDRDLHLYLYRLLIERYGSTMLEEIDRILQQESGWMDIKSSLVDEEGVMSESLPPLEDIVKNWVSTATATQLIADNNNGRELTRSGIIDLLERGTVRGVKIGMQWYVDPESAAAYKVQGRGRLPGVDYTGGGES